MNEHRRSRSEAEADSYVTYLGGPDDGAAREEERHVGREVRLNGPVSHTPGGTYSSVPPRC
jgi:hypothetical protein